VKIKNVKHVLIIINGIIQQRNVNGIIKIVMDLIIVINVLLKKMEMKI